MSALMMTIGGLLIPLGFYLMIEGGDSLLWYGRFAVIFGIICWGISFRITQSDERDAKKEKRELIDLVASIDRKIKNGS